MLDCNLTDSGLAVPLAAGGHLGPIHSLGEVLAEVAAAYALDASPQRRREAAAVESGGGASAAGRPTSSARQRRRPHGASAAGSALSLLGASNESLLAING
jgi:hypothetical protein